MALPFFLGLVDDAQAACSSGEADGAEAGLNATVLAGGQILPQLYEALWKRNAMYQAADDISEAVHGPDILLFAAVSVFSIPIFRFVYNTIYTKGANATNNTLVYTSYETSYVYQIATHVSQLARLAILVYLMDCVVLVLKSMGITLNDKLHMLSPTCSKILVVLWASQRLCVLKRYLLSQAISRLPDKLGRAYMIDRLADGLIIFCTSLFLLDILDVAMGVGFTSMFAFGSAGTLVMGLASRDVATMFVSGLVLSTTDRIREGEEVRFGDGTAGVVQKIGWMHTTLRHYDELIEVIPNSQLGMQRVVNISRVEKCRVKQILRFRYEDADLLPGVCESILEEIKLALPDTVITEKKPFRAVFTNFREDHLEVMVDTHYKCKPTGQVYWDTRQKVMHAIHKAVKKSDAEFVTTYYPRGINKK